MYQIVLDNDLARSEMEAKATVEATRWLDTSLARSTMSMRFHTTSDMYAHIRIQTPEENQLTENRQFFVEAASMQVCTLAVRQRTRKGNLLHHHVKNLQTSERKEESMVVVT
jgi:hypothetical protein